MDGWMDKEGQVGLCVSGRRPGRNKVRATRKTTSRTISGCDMCFFGVWVYKVVQDFVM